MRTVVPLLLEYSENVNVVDNFDAGWKQTFMFHLFSILFT